MNYLASFLAQHGGVPPTNNLGTGPNKPNKEGSSGSLGSPPPLVERGERLSGGLAIREVLGFPAVLLPELPIPTTLVVDVPGLPTPMTIATHRSCPRRSFDADEWLGMVALAHSRVASPAAFKRWCVGQKREQLAGVGPASDCSTTTRRVLAAFGAALRAVVIEGGVP